MFNRLMAGLFDDPEWSETEPAPLVHNVIADLLPYRFYDEDEELYVNEGNTGFLVEVNPVTSSVTAAADLHSVLMAKAPVGATIQFLNWTSPDIDRHLSNWARHRLAGDALVKEMAERRMDHFRDARFGTDHVIKAIPHNRRVFVAAWVDGEASVGQRKALKELRRALYSVFDGEANVRHVAPTEFLAVLGELLHCRGKPGDVPFDYTPLEPINHQMPGAGLTVRRSAIALSGEPAMSVGCATVARYPAEWEFPFGIVLNGVPQRPADRAQGPVLASFTVRVRSAQETGTFLTKKRAGLQHTAGTQFAKFSNNLSEKMEEFEQLNAQVEIGERLLDTAFVVAAYVKGGADEARQALSELAKIYRVAGLVLENDAFIQLPVFLSALPFAVTGKRMGDLKRLTRMKILKGAAATGLAPLHGEWAGAGNGKGVLLVGRQGQVFDWDNFQSEGNYNVSVVGKSGAGKSVFMQELVTSIYASGGRVVVIDDGYSFHTTCQILGGSFIGFDGETEIRMNPFSMLSATDMAKDEYRADAIGLITRVIGSMAALGADGQGRVEELEESYIARVVGEVWDEKGVEGEVTDVWEKLKAIQGEELRLKDVVVKLDAFTRGGAYGSYFAGPANLQLDQPFTVFELSGIKGQRGLQDVVMQMIMFLSTELMFKTPRSVPVAILIDEAWDLLQTHATAKFIEGVVRRARKYTGSLITGTQSIDDYYDNVAASVCLQNSDWTVFLAQKDETIDRLVADNKLSVGSAIAGQLKALNSVRGLYSEMAIKGPTGWTFGRLLLDPFSLAVYSSKGATIDRIKGHMDRGLSKVEAIRALVAAGEVE